MQKRSIIKKLGIVVALLLAAASGVYLYRTFTLGPITDFVYERDKEQVYTLFNDNWYWLYGGEVGTYDVDYTFRTLSPRRNPQYFGTLQVKVMREGEKLLGFVAYFKESFYAGRVLFLAVDPAYRGKRYAEKLLSFACKDLFTQKVAVIKLTTRPSNTRAQAVYKRVGFVETNHDETYAYFELKP